VSTTEAYRQETPVNQRVCVGTRKDGQPCQAGATPDGYCFAHSPALRERTAAARRAGGHNSSRTVRARKLVSKDTRGIATLLEEAMEAVAGRKLAPSRGSAIASLVNAWVRVHELALEETELASIKAQLEGRKWGA
jgi:Family of unknown function (DUF5763)